MLGALTMTMLELRTEIVRRMREDLIGPTSAAEVLEDRPTDRYLTGILYPAESEIAAQDDDGFGAGGATETEGTTGADAEDVPLISTLKPSSAGISFSV